MSEEIQNQASFKRVNISDLAPKKDASSIFLIKFIQLAEAKDGKNYLNVVFTDATGDLESRMWSEAVETAAEFKKGDFAQVKGKLNIYQGRKQFIISQIEKVDKKDVDTGDFVFKASQEPDVMYQKLLDLVGSLEDVYIKELLKNVLNDAEIMRRLKIWQAGKSVHHAYQAGLLEHILSCTELAMNLSNHYQVNQSYVVAGAILHDLCKVYELTDGLNVEYTEEGKLIGHLVKGVEIIDRFASRIPRFPYQMKIHLKHIIISHHGELSYGSPKLPLTAEAYLVHLIDLMDSKMNAMLMTRRLDNNIGHWSNYIKHLDRMVYKTDLPTYTEFEQAPEPYSKQNDSRQKNSKPVKGKGQRELKQSLGKLLENVKIDD